ncbi:MAG TPA: pyridoxamine 5'-phosphate oxidase family protein, partial [Burkholderiaceae bacterium]|nr:pyridoxamine 5'-phosphate oxidase family protein [Burkholderiaceae bacterium]
MASFQRDYLTDPHRAFYPRLPFLVVGAVDREGRPWATILDGQPGFLQAVDDRHLRVEAQADPDDPAISGLQPGAAIGLLGIELETRRRNRLNGHVDTSTPTAFTVSVDRSYGNCPQYIHTRDLRYTPDDPRRSAPVDRMNRLDDEARDTIQRSGMFFVASYAEELTRAVDVSHRGGRPGFVDIDGRVSSSSNDNDNDND